MIWGLGRLEVLYCFHKGVCDCFQMNTSTSGGCMYYHCLSLKVETRSQGEMDVSGENRSRHFTWRRHRTHWLNFSFWKCYHEPCTGQRDPVAEEQRWEPVTLSSNCTVFTTLSRVPFRTKGEASHWWLPHARHFQVRFPAWGQVWLANRNHAVITRLPWTHTSYKTRIIFAAYNVTQQLKS